MTSYEEEDRQIAGLGDSCIKCVLDRLATLSIPTIRVEALENSLLPYFVSLLSLVWSLEALKMYCVMRIPIIYFPDILYTLHTSVKLVLYAKVEANLRRQGTPKMFII